MWLLTQELAKDPSSHVAAAVNGWPVPWPQEAFVLANLYDLWSDKNAKPYPRPTDQGPRRTVAAVPQSVVREALAARGH